MSRNILADNSNVNSEISLNVLDLGRSRDLPPPYTRTDTLHTQPVTSQPVINQTIVVHQHYKHEPIPIVCPSCHKRTMTKISYANSQKTHVIAGFICGLTFFCMLCCLAALPYVIPKCKKAEHYCSNCNYYFGPYSPLYELSVT
ncbi:unnamed protein product [Leptidea sinapis]|uniref:LITAF domain-containing protein n=1 Tax=Leptidea sinapis TaxID=189913 RepID=A0A5E4Q332_9NEOP|nr:unnamed protein product [Leptidea sinapis]